MTSNVMRTAAANKLLKELLEQKYREYNNRSFIEKDPICIPHGFTKKEDIEIAGFFSATIAWGNRNAIIKNGRSLLERMDNAPHGFITQFSERDEQSFSTFTHRTFNGTDCVYFLRALKNIYKNHGGLEKSFGSKNRELKDRIIHFRDIFFELPHPSRTQKHVSDPRKKSSVKRLCMFLRWMVRKDSKGVDFGLWKSITPAQLMLPLDVHSGNVSRKLGLLQRKQNDWQAVEEVTSRLREFDPDDPVKYDFALFGMGVNGEV